MKEYGGYIELDAYTGKPYYEGLLLLNCGRSCLKVLIQEKKIHKIYLPYFLCDCIRKTCELYGVTYEYYSIFPNFMPDFDKKLRDGEWIYIVNYYGQLSDDLLLAFKQRYQRIILDNVQDFFRKPLDGIDTLYSLRKYFGLADGAYLSTDLTDCPQYDLDTSYMRMNFLLGRFEERASDFYLEYVKNNEFFDHEPVKEMSLLTRNLLRAIDYQYVKNVRTQNYIYVHNRLGKWNKLTLKISDGAFAYPFLVEKGALLRKKMQEIKVYIPTLWPDVLMICKEDSLEYQFAMHILPLPVDQRYTLEDMKYICDSVEEAMFAINI